MSATLENVKKALGITSSEQDATLEVYFSDVINFLTEAGIPESAISDGLAARGVADLWNYGGNDGKLSDYFWQRATQLSYKK